MTSNDELTMSIQATNKLRRYGKLCKQYVTGLYPRYRKLNVGGKLSLSDEKSFTCYLGLISLQCFVWFLILFHVALFATLIIYKPARIFQFLYNLSQKLKAIRFGWLILASFMGKWMMLLPTKLSLTLCLPLVRMLGR